MGTARILPSGNGYCKKQEGLRVGSSELEVRSSELEVET